MTAVSVFTFSSVVWTEKVKTFRTFGLLRSSNSKSENYK